MCVWGRTHIAAAGADLPVDTFFLDSQILKKCQNGKENLKVMKSLKARSKSQREGEKELSPCLSRGR